MAEKVILWICSMLVPITLITVGLLFMKYPIKSINVACGYRTKRSMSSQKAWDYANLKMGKVYFIVGLILAVVTAVLNLIFSQKPDIGLYISGGLSVLCCFSPVFFIEPALKKLIQEEENETPIENA